MFNHNSTSKNEKDKTDSWSFSFDYQHFSNKNKPRSLLGRRTLGPARSQQNENIGREVASSCSKPTLNDRTPLRSQNISGPSLTHPINPNITPIDKFAQPALDSQLIFSRSKTQSDNNCQRRLGFSTPFKSTDSLPPQEIDKVEAKDVSSMFVNSNLVSKDLNTSFICEDTFPLSNDNSLSNETDNRLKLTVGDTIDLSQTENGNNSCFMTAHEIHPPDLSSFQTNDFTFKTPRRMHDSFSLKTPGRNFTLFSISQSPIDPLAGILNEDNESFNTDNVVNCIAENRKEKSNNNLSCQSQDYDVQSQTPSVSSLATHEKGSEILRNGSKSETETNDPILSLGKLENPCLTPRNCDSSLVQSQTPSISSLATHERRSEILRNDSNSETKRNDPILSLGKLENPCLTKISPRNCDSSLVQSQTPSVSSLEAHEKRSEISRNDSKSETERNDSTLSSRKLENPCLTKISPRNCDSSLDQKVSSEIRASTTHSEELTKKKSKYFSNAESYQNLPNGTPSSAINDLPTVIVNDKKSTHKSQTIPPSPVNKNQLHPVPADVFMNARIIKPQPQNILFVNRKPYAALSLLGRGGSSEVYQVLDENSSRLLAIKCVNLAAVEESTANGYLNEIELLSKLQGCPSVIKMLDHEYVESSKMLYVVMEKGDIDLSKLIKDTTKIKKVPMSMIIYYWSEMLSAVKDIHDKGVIHSDLKPSNFLLVCGRLKLIDFGIASSIQGDMTSVEKDVIRGTFNYISPEAICAGDNRYHKISYKSDVWSLGCILYNLLFGQTPFSHITNTLGKFQAIADPNHKIKFPKDCERVPPALMISVRWCLIKDPKSRPTVDTLLKLSNLAVRVPQIDNLWYQYVIQEFPDCCVRFEDLKGA